MKHKYIRILRLSPSNLARKSEVSKAIQLAGSVLTTTYSGSKSPIEWQLTDSQSE